MSNAIAVRRVRLADMARKPREIRELDKALSAILKAIWIKSGLLQKELGDEIGVSQDRISTVLRGLSPIGVGEADALCQALGQDLLPVLAAAEWMVYGQPPEGLTRQEQIDVAALFEAAACYRDKDNAPTPAAPKPTPLFSDRRNDGDPGVDALPRIV